MALRKYMVGWLGLLLGVLVLPNTPCAQDIDPYHETKPFDLIPKEFHGKWKFAYYFGASKVLDPREYLGKTITIEANGYIFGDIECFPFSSGYSYFPPESKDYLDFRGRQDLPVKFQKQYTEMSSVTVACVNALSEPKLDRRVFKRLAFNHYYPSDNFLTITVWGGPDYILEPVSIHRPDQGRPE